MNISKTDYNRIVSLLTKASEIIREHCLNSVERDKARQCLQMAKKLKRKDEREND